MTDKSIIERQEGFLRQEEIKQRLDFLATFCAGASVPKTEADEIAWRKIKTEQRTLRGELVALVGDDEPHHNRTGWRLVPISGEQLRAQIKIYQHNDD